VLPFDTIAGALHELSHEEKARLRVLLDDEIASSTASGANGAIRSKQIIGLFADEPDVMDRVMEAVYERRSRPLRRGD
jgi:hypothetical protein